MRPNDLVVCITFKYGIPPKNILCAKYEQYNDGYFSLKDDEDGIIYSEKSEFVKHMTIFKRDNKYWKEE